MSFILSDAVEQPEKVPWIVCLCVYLTIFSSFHGGLKHRPVAYLP